MLGEQNKAAYVNAFLHSIALIFSLYKSRTTLGLARRVKAKILLASTSEVYGDPEVHPQPETYWGHVNPIGPRACYDEGKRVAETLMYAYAKQVSLPVPFLTAIMILIFQGASGYPYCKDL